MTAKPAASPLIERIVEAPLPRRDPSVAAAFDALRQRVEAEPALAALAAFLIGALVARPEAPAPPCRAEVGLPQPRT